MTIESLPPKPLTLAAVESLNEVSTIQNASPQFSLATDSNSVVGMSLLLESKIVVLGLNPVNEAWQQVTEFEFPDTKSPEAQAEAQEEMHTTTDETFEWFVKVYGPQNVAVLDASEYG